MYRGVREAKQKSLRRLWMEYINLCSKDADTGHWEEVEPYQKGWLRFFVLRDDIRNRSDAREIRRALELIQNVQYCPRENFTEWNYKARAYVPIRHKLGWITPEKYNSLDERIKSYFRKAIWVDTYKYPYPHKKERTGYVVKYDYWFVYQIQPNIITHHWIPNPETESRLSELQKILYSRENVGELHKVMGWSAHTKKNYGTTSVWMKNKNGYYLTENDIQDEVM